MSTATASAFFALLSLLCVAAVVVVAGLGLARRASPTGAAAALVDDLGQVALWLAWVVALVTTLGSLYYSEIADFTPCKLCWFQRIAMYPLALLLLVAAVRRDRAVWVYVVPQAAVGAVIAAYHAQLQAFPEQGSSFCTAAAPCTDRYVWELGFVSLPFMALTAFAFVIAMVLVAWSTDADRAGAHPADDAGHDADVDDVDERGPAAGTSTPDPDRPPEQVGTR